MNAWQDSLANGNGVCNNHSYLDNSMFNPNSNIDPTQIHNAQLQQGMQNGAMRNQSPAFQNPQYQVNPVVSSKRPRPSEDSIAASPRQHPGHLNLSRSQTPQQGGYPGFQGGQHGGQQLQAPTPYQRLQQTPSHNATPSPTMQNQQFRPPNSAQRVQTASPNQFPQPQQGLGMSPQNHNAPRVNTSQNPGFQMGGMDYMGGTSMPQGYNQNFGGMPNMTSGPGPNSMPAQGVALSQNLQQRQQEAQRQYMMRMQQQQTAQNPMMAAQAQARQQMAGMNPMMAAGQHTNMSTPTRPPNQPQQGMSTMQFTTGVAQFMQRINWPFDPNPTVCGRPIQLYQLYLYVLKSGGNSKRVTAANHWPKIAQALGFEPSQFPSAPQELASVFERNCRKGYLTLV
ncbi:hypothetical protein LTS18_004490 [Coniosporium uncinatum]|uniref:Uncharacterized protein n=1 Tax=Coniosporium uncinatum TaxID=93489 RepID=A0ACC3DCQ7_9PEZI|nr:hypothetical protein LTS18_004490 [Coniosporium uncinatum]